MKEKQSVYQSKYEADAKGYKLVTPEGVFRPIIVEGGRLVVDNPKLSEKRRISREDKTLYARRRFTA